eukprot:19215-Heterococcus_DN1.PRE.1
MSSPLVSSCDTKLWRSRAGSLSSSASRAGCCACLASIPQQIAQRNTEVLRHRLIILENEHAASRCLLPGPPRALTEQTQKKPLPPNQPFRALHNEASERLLLGSYAQTQSQCTCVLAPHATADRASATLAAAVAAVSSVQLLCMHANVLSLCIYAYLL